VREGSFQFATCKDATDTEEILAFLNESVQDSCEVFAVDRGVSEVERRGLGRRGVGVR